MVSDSGVVLITKDGCPNCDIAKNLMITKGVEFQIVNVSDRDNMEYLEYLKTQGYRSVPLIFSNGEYIGDHTKVSRLFPNIGE